MKSRHHYITRIVLIFAGACVFLIGGIQSQARTSSGGAHLIVQRAPNVGTELAVRLAIDGRAVADIQRDHRYVGSMPGGRHVLSVVPMPNIDLRQPTAVRVSARSGRTYIFSAGWEADHLVLRRIHSATEAEPAKPVPRR
jgi:hypothetical protein